MRYAVAVVIVYASLDFGQPDTVMLANCNSN